MLLPCLVQQCLQARRLSHFTLCAIHQTRGEVVEMTAALVAVVIAAVVIVAVDVVGAAVAAIKPSFPSNHIFLIILGFLFEQFEQFLGLQAGAVTAAEHHRTA